MAAFEAFIIPNSPKVKDEGKKSKSKEVLTLAAFHPIPKIVFEDVKVGRKVSQELLIHNPNSSDVQVELIPKLPLADYNFEITSTKFEVAAGQDFDLTITWRPSKAGTAKAILGLQTNTKFRADLVIVCVAVAPANNQKKILVTQNGLKTSAKPKPAEIPAQRVRKPVNQPPERKNSVVPRGNKENLVNSTKPSRPEPAPRKVPPASSAAHPSLFENLVISPFVSRPNRFKDIELSPVVNGPCRTNPERSSVSETIRRETHGVTEIAAVPTFVEKLDSVQEQPDAVDYSYKEVDSIVGVFEPKGCSTSVKVKESSSGIVAADNDRLSGRMYNLDSLGKDTYTKKVDLNEHRLPNCNELRAPCHTDLSGTILGSISEDVMTEVQSAPALTIPSLDHLKTERMSPVVVTRRKIAVDPDLKIFSPDTLEERKNEKEPEPAKKSQCLTNSVRKAPLSCLTLSRAANASRRISNLSSVAKARRQEKSEFLYDADALISETINNDLVAASTADPFLTDTLFFDDSWKLKQEKDMIKWLNVLLTPPAELATDTDSATLDIADVWQRCCRTDRVELAPTKEDVSTDIYDTQDRMNSLRKAAISFLAKSEIRQVLGKVVVHIDKKLLVIREDKDLHVDTGLKYQIMELLLSYNPLWLRIGLEAVFGRTVSLASNSDVLGLAKFILENLLNDKNIAVAHSHPTLPHLRLPTYADAMKKFILKKFLFLVYFLDQAKGNKLIGHDPCLFMKKSKYKESREILVAFASVFLSGVGDVLKHLALLGYHLSVKQQYIEEYEFAVTCLQDLRDGVRLVRVMEIILSKDTLMKKLRVPAISIMQKIHNMEVALKSLTDSGYEIVGNITAKDLVKGHYEKTLSLLWQIIYKFQAPRLEKAARIIQSWWNKTKLHRELRSRIQANKRTMYAAAATRIQTAWRVWLARKRVVHLREERAAEIASREAATIVIQKTWRMCSSRKQFKRAIRASNRIKEWFFGAMITRELRAKFLAKRESAIKIQSLFRGYLTRKRFANLRCTAAALRIQTWFRRRRAAKLLEVAATYVEVWIGERKRQTEACRVIQTHFRGYINVKEERNKYVALRNATIVIQRRFKLYLLMKKDRAAFLSAHRAAIICQQAFRAKMAMKELRIQYITRKNATVAIQKWFRAQREVRMTRGRFLLERSAAVTIQTWFKATQLMRRNRREYLRMKEAVIVIEERYLAVVAGRRQKFFFELRKRSAVVIQRWYRSVKQMEVGRRSYVRQRNAALMIQRKWRATLQMRAEVKAYAEMRSAALTFQGRWRALMTMRKERANFQNLKNAAVFIQRRRRALRAGKTARRECLNLQKAAFLEQLKKAAVLTQRMWRAKKLAEQQRNMFLALKRAAIIVQRKYRQKICLRSGIADKIRKEQAAIKIQALWRGYIVRKKQCAASAKINERCRLAAKAACEEKTLAYRLQSAVQLLKLGYCNKAMEALVALQKITVLSRELCVALVEHDVVTGIYDFLSGLNRSEFHRQFLIPGTAILLNLTKYSETTRFVWQNGYRVFFYLHLMNIWINREEEIFLNCATILWHFAQYPEFAKKMIAEPNMSRLLEIIARKASKKTSLLSASKKGDILPADSPSWGLVLKDGKPTKFCDELFAVQNLISVLYGSDALSCGNSFIY